MDEMNHIMKKYLLKLDEAIDFVKKKRPVINPNNGFLIQLKSFDVELQNFQTKK